MGLAEQLKENDLFNEIELADLEALVEKMNHKFYDEGQQIFSQHDEGYTMYIIRRGRIRIHMHDPRTDEDITLTFFGRNDIVGELTLLDQQPRSASASAAEALEVLQLERDDFIHFLNERPQVGIAMMRGLSQKLRNTTSYIEEFRMNEADAKPKPEPVVLSREPSQTITANIIDRINKPTDEGEEPKRRIAGDKTGLTKIMDRIHDDQEDIPPDEKILEDRPGASTIFDRAKVIDKADIQAALSESAPPAPPENNQPANIFDRVEQETNQSNDKDSADPNQVHGVASIFDRIAQHVEEDHKDEDKSDE